MGKLFTFEAPAEIYAKQGLYNSFTNTPLEEAQFSSEGHTDFDGNGSTRSLNLDNLAGPLNGGAQILKFYLKPNSINPLTLGFGKGGAHCHCQITFVPNLRIDLYGLYGIFKARSYKTMIIDTWNQVVVESNFESALDGGYIKVYLNGELVIDYTGKCNTDDDLVDGADLYYFSANGGPTWYLDDLQIDGGSSGDFYGTLLRPTVDSSSTMAGRVGGISDSDVLGETNVNTGTYVESDTAGQYVLTEMSDISWTAPQIDIVQVVAYVARTGAITTSAAHIDSGGTTDTSSYDTIGGGGSYVTVSKVFSVDPDTTVAWDEAGVNGLKAGIITGV